MYLMQCTGMKAETLFTVMGELSNKIMPFATDPQLQQALSKQDIITPAMLEQGQDIFLQIPEYKLEAWRPLLSLIVQQFAQHFERRPDMGATTPILFMLDEFPENARRFPVSLEQCMRHPVDDP